MTPVTYELVLIHARNWASWQRGCNVHLIRQNPQETTIRWQCVDHGVGGKLLMVVFLVKRHPLEQIPEWSHQCCQMFYAGMTHLGWNSSTSNLSFLLVPPCPTEGSSSALNSQRSWFHHKTSLLDAHCLSISSKLVVEVLVEHRGYWTNSSQRTDHWEVWQSTRSTPPWPWHTRMACHSGEDGGLLSGWVWLLMMMVLETLIVRVWMGGSIWSAAGLERSVGADVSRHPVPSTYRD